MAYKIKNTNWQKEKKNNAVIFRNIKNPSLTYEIHKFDKEEAKELMANYYSFPAIDGKGIPNSPDLSPNKKEAIKLAKEYMEEN